MPASKSTRGRGEKRTATGPRASSASPTIESLIAHAGENGPHPVYLFSGDEFLVSQASSALIDALVPSSRRDFNLSILDGAVADAAAIARDLAQAPMFRGVKLVVVRDAAILTGKADLEDEVSRARQLFKDGREKDATRRMLAVIAKARWSVADLTEASATKWQKELGLSSASLDGDFLKTVRSMAEREGMAVPASDTAKLEKMLEGGAPPGNSLLLTCEKPDRRLSLSRLVESLGVHLVCKAERAGSKIESLDISAVKQAVLSRYGKRLEPKAEQALKQAIGTELRLMAGELEKLCLYTGDANVITLADVEAVGVRQIREEDFWELASAVSGRNLSEALWYLHDAFDHGKHAVQILAGIAAGLRKVLQVRAIADRHGLRRIGREPPSAMIDEVGKQRGRKPHPFALKMELERCLGWPSTAALARALEACRRADRALKSSRGDPRLVLERLVMRLCEEEAGGRRGRC